MSQRKEKYARELGRRVTDVENRLDQLAIIGVDTANEESFCADDAFEEHLLQARYTAECKENARNKAFADRRMRRILEAEEAARSWKAVAYGALVAAIIVLIIAIAAVHAKATEPVPQESAPANELAILIPETTTPAENDAKKEPVFVTNLTQIADSDEVAEDFENEKIEAALLDGATTIDNCTVTHYCICKECCGKDPDHPDYGVTASGLYALPNITVAVDPDVIPLGSDVLVDYGDGEIHYYVAADTGSGVAGNHIDLCVKDHETAQQLGRRTATVVWTVSEAQKGGTP